jgi:hypothetical protein
MTLQTRPPKIVIAFINELSPARRPLRRRRRNRESNLRLKQLASVKKVGEPLSQTFYLILAQWTRISFMLSKFSPLAFEH